MAAPAKKSSTYWLPVTPVRESRVQTKSVPNTSFQTGESSSNAQPVLQNLLISSKHSLPVQYYSGYTWVSKPDSLFKQFGRVRSVSPVESLTDKGELCISCSFSAEKTLGSSNELPENTFSQDLLQAQEQERHNLANELHDTLGQSVILMKNHILRLKNNLPESTETIEQINTLAEMVTDTLQKIREISYGLRPYELNLFGLTHAIRSLTEDIAEAASWHLTLELPKIENLFLKDHEIYVYRVLQQCLEVVQKQAAATVVNFVVQPNPDTIEWHIQVTGHASFCSFLKTNSNTDFNLLRLQEQLKIVSGSISFTFSAPEVTTIHLTIPIQPIAKHP
ncbi:sensor histidine kinase [Adhaeribacter radiodurans]|uniref:Signal transduction histidine kinase subgroup 3 dimerisation and phosphoacceptor domain-containing protein n=1 Tax=Adhaeribacter radiodurans TaxID=2745197 RepID=A0A7L7L5I7_9BACT|nr:histidine kinase [Adhaeribacter radiodurans]QMU28067.1 hypothetical protein HUW48_08410 [Adhaeribacter radiodurans]